MEEILLEIISPNLKLKSELLLASITGNSIKSALPSSTTGIEKSVLAEVYFKYALNCDEEGDIETAVKFYKKCVETSQDPKINKFLSSTLANLATIFDEHGKTEVAVKYLQESLRLDEITQNNNGIYVSAMKLSEMISDKNKSLAYLKRAKNCAIELNEPFYIASSDLALGDFYYNQKDYAVALKYYDKAKSLAQNNFTKDNIVKIEQRINDIKKVYNAG